MTREYDYNGSCPGCGEEYPSPGSRDCPGCARMAAEEAAGQALLDLGARLEAVEAERDFARAALAALREQLRLAMPGEGWVVTGLRRSDGLKVYLSRAQAGLQWMASSVHTRAVVLDEVGSDDPLIRVCAAADRRHRSA